MDMLFTALFVTIHIITGVYGKINTHQFSNEVVPLATCIYEICKLHAIFYKFTVIIYTNTSKDNNDPFTEIVINELVATKIPFIKTNDIKKIRRTDIYESTVLVMVSLKSCEDLIETDLVIFDKKIKYILIIDEFLSNDCKRKIETRLSDLKEYDATFISSDENTENHTFSTMIPEIDEETCQVAKTSQMQFINSCNKGSLKRQKINDIFPDKAPTNLKKCNFNVGMATLYPYSMLKSNKTLKDLVLTDSFHGADIELMKVIANKFNGNLKLFYIYRDEGYPYLDLDLRHYLQNGSLDVCGGGLYRIYGDDVAYSGIYSRQSAIWIYTVERDIRSWQSLAVKITGLYVFLIFYLCYVVLWNIISKFDEQVASIKDSLFYAWGALIGASDLQDARSFKQKILNIMYLIMCLHLSAYVSTQIYYYLTIQRSPENFKTLDDLISSDRTPYLMHVAKHFIDEKKHNDFVNTSRSCDTFQDCEEKVLKNKGSTIIIDGQLPPWQSLTAVNDEARVLRVAEDIIIVYHEIVIRKSSPIVSAFQKTTQILFETGICHKLYVEAIGIIVVDKAKIANKNILSNSYSCTVGCEISLSQSAGVFYIWIIGCVLSCFVFIFEILTKSLSL